MNTYHSKVGSEIVLPLLVTMAGTGVLMAYERIWPGLLLIVLLAVFILHMLITTRYQIQGDRLTIRCGFFLVKRIPIRDIRSVRPSRNFLSAPAASLDRLMIRFDKYDYILVSPKDKAGFMADLVGINPDIQCSPGP